MARDFTASIYPGPPPAAPQTVVRGGGDGLDVAFAKMPGAMDIFSIILAMQQMAQQRQENQRDRELQLGMQESDLRAGAGLRAAQEAAQRAAAAVSNFEIERAKRFMDSDVQARKLAAELYELQIANARRAGQFEAAAQPLELERANIALQELKDKYALGRREMFNTQFDAAKKAILNAVSVTGEPADVLAQASAKAFSEAGRAANRWAELRQPGFDSAMAFEESLRGDLAANVVSANASRWMKNGQFDASRFAATLLFMPELAPEGKMATSLKSSWGVNDFFDLNAEELKQKTFGPFIAAAAGRGASAPPQQATDPKTMVLTGSRGVIARYVNNRMSAVGDELLNATDKGKTSLGMFYNRLIAKLESDVGNWRKSGASGLAADDQIARRQALDSLKGMGLTGFAQSVMAGAFMNDEKLENIASVKMLETPARVGLRQYVEREVNNFIADTIGEPTRRAEFGTAIGLLKPLEKLEPGLFQSLIDQPGPLREAWDVYHRLGLVEALRSGVANQPRVAGISRDVDMREKELQDMINGMYDGLNYNTRGRNRADFSAPAKWRDLIPQAAGTVVPPASRPVVAPPPAAPEAAATPAGAAPAVTAPPPSLGTKSAYDPSADSLMQGFDD